MINDEWREWWREEEEEEDDEDRRDHRDVDNNVLDDFEVYEEANDDEAIFGDSSISALHHAVDDVNFPLP